MAVHSTRWPHKPPLGYPIDFAHPLAQGLAFFAPLNEGSGLAVYDAVTRFALPVSGGVWGSGLMSGLGFTTTSAGATATIPPGLQLGFPLTIAVGFRFLGIPSGEISIWSVLNSSGRVYSLEADTGTSSFIVSCNGNTLSGGSPVWTVGQDYTFASSISSGSQKNYTNGIPATNGATAFSPSYSGGYFAMGGAGSLFTGRTPDFLVYWAGLWNRALLAPEHAALARNPWQFFEPRRSLNYWWMPPLYSVTGPSSAVAGAASSFAVVPNVTVNTDTLTLSDGGAGGVFSPSSSLSWSLSSGSESFSYTPPTSGSKTLTVASGGGYQVSPATIPLTVSAIGFGLSGPSTGTVGQAITCSVTPASSTTDTLGLSDGGRGGVFVPTSLSWSASSASRSFTYTQPNAGTYSLAVSSTDGGVVTGSPLSVAISGSSGRRSVRWYPGLRRPLCRRVP